MTQIAIIWLVMTQIAIIWLVKRLIELRKLIIRQEQDTISLQQFVIEYLSRMERRK